MLTLVHLHASEPAGDFAIHLRGAQPGPARMTVLTHESLNAHNTFEHPATVVPRTTAIESKGEELRCVLAPASVTRFDVRLETG